MFKIVFLSVVLLLMPLATFAKSPPSDLILPPAPKSKNPSSDCEQMLLKWDFAEETIVTRNKENIFLIIDRYGGERESPDYRGTMCRVKDMYETWAVPELFHDINNIALTDDGKYLVNGIGNPGCSTEEDVKRLSEMSVLIFHSNGEPVKEYYLDQILPKWKENCQSGGTIDWLAGSMDFPEAISEDNSTFTLKTSDGVTHSFNVKNGAKLNSPSE